MVSIIIPNYNHARFLQERIDSVLNQTYRDFEVIILDDCSTDNSQEIIRKYTNEPKVSHIVFNKTNSGSTFRQWEKGFELAKGEYIWIAESDDVADPDFLRILISAIGNDKSVTLAVSAITFIDENNNITGHTSVSKTNKIRKYSSAKFIRENMLLGNHLLNASSAIFRKNTLQNIPNSYTQLKASGDYMFWIEIANKGKVVEVPYELDYFRKSSISVTPRLYGTGQTFDEALVIYDRLKDLSYLKGLYKNIVVAYRLKQIKEGTKFNNEEVRKRCFDNWVKKTKHPGLDKATLYAYGFWRKIKRFFRNLI